jgi:hypothetical protein
MMSFGADGDADGRSLLWCTQRGIRSRDTQPGSRKSGHSALPASTFGGFFGSTSTTIPIPDTGLAGVMGSRALMRLQDQMRRMRHSPLGEQVENLNQMLRGHYAYYGIAGNLWALQKVHRTVKHYWRRMLSSRSWKGKVCWKKFQQIEERFPLRRPKLHLPYGALQTLATL